jgi:hypothetical protein
MSARTCSQLHIQTIAKNYVDIFKFGDVLAISNELHKENMKSINHRYDENTKCIKWKTVETIEVSDIELYKLIETLDYRSCDHKQYKNSKSYIRLQSLLAFLEQKIKQELGIENISKTIHYDLAKRSI